MEKEIVKRLAPTKDTLTLLFSLSGNVCAFPGCSNALFRGDNIFVGQVCHIESAKEGGERFNAESSNEDRRQYSNLMLMCYEHHKVTDNVEIYTTEKMHQIKASHENKFRAAPTYATPDQIDRVAQIELQKSLATIQNTTEKLLSGQEEQTQLIKQVLAAVQNENADKFSKTDFDKQIDAINSLRKSFQQKAGIRLFQKMIDEDWESLSPRERYRIKANLGIFHLDLLEDEEAAKNFIDSHAHQPDNPKAIGWAILGYSLIGDAENAKGLIKKGLEINPNDVGIYGALIRLNRSLSLKEIIEMVPVDIRQHTEVSFEIARAARFVKGSGMPVRIPVIEMIEIGAGGGSIAGVDRLGRLTVGPQSAGSDPGPVAFGRGGTQPTVTDADITLGYIRPEGFAEGQFKVDGDAATRALGEGIGAVLGLSPTEAADGVSRIVDESMASAARMHAVEWGKDLTPRMMIAFGGNGPLHAARLARSAGVSRILIPVNPGVGSAVGFLFAPVGFELVRSRYTLLGALDPGAINALFQDMSRAALSVVRQGAPETPVTTTRTAFMRYHGQGHEIEIGLPDRTLVAEDLPKLTQTFETAYARQFSRPVPGMDIEVLNWAVRVETAPPPLSPAPPPPAVRTRRPDRQVSIFCDVTATDRPAGVIERAGLSPGDCLQGPVLITEPQTTTFVAADFTAQVDARGNLILIRQGA